MSGDGPRLDATMLRSTPLDPEDGLAEMFSNGDA
jgi:hypothetical protein